MASLEQQTLDRSVSAARSASARADFVEFAALADQVVLEVEQQPGHLARLGDRALEREERMGQRPRLLIEAEQEARPVELRMDALSSGARASTIAR